MNDTDWSSSAVPPPPFPEWAPAPPPEGLRRLDIVVDVFFLTAAALGFLLSYWCTGSFCACFSEVTEDAETPVLEGEVEMAAASPQPLSSSSPIASPPTPPSDLRKARADAPLRSVHE